MLDRIIGVFKLDPNTFEEVEHDQGATGQAAIIVIVVALVGAIGSGIGGALSGGMGSFLSSFFMTLLTVLIGWFLWSGVIYIVGTTVFGGKADMGEMLRVVGFSYAPQVLGIIPCVGTIIGFFWTLAALYVAVKQGLDIDGGKTIGTILIGFLVYLGLACVLAMLFGGTAAMLGGLTG
jgi:hypothetical protein